MAEFKASLSGAAPAPDLAAPLAALWWAAKGNWDQAHKHRPGRARRDGRLGARLSAPRRGRSRQCRLLVPPGRQAGRDRFARDRMGADGFWRCSEVEEHECGKRQTDQGRHRRLGNGDRAGGPRPGHLELKTVFRRLDRIRRRAEQPCLAGRCGDAGHAARDQRGMRPAGGAHRARPQRTDQSALGVRPQELFLSGPAAGLPDQPVQVADRRRGRGHGRTGGRPDRHRRHRTAASGAGRRQVAARPQPDHVLCRPQPLRRGADGDRLQARHPRRRAGQGLCDQAALDPALSRHLRRRHGEGKLARRRQRLRAQAGRRRSAPAARSRT